MSLTLSAMAGLLRPSMLLTWCAYLDRSRLRTWYVWLLATCGWLASARVTDGSGCARTNACACDDSSDAWSPPPPPAPAPAPRAAPYTVVTLDCGAVVAGRNATLECKERDSGALL